MDIDQHCQNDGIDMLLDSDDELNLMDRVLHLSSEKIEEMKGISSLQTELRYLMIRNIYDAALQRREALLTGHNCSLPVQKMACLPSWSDVILSFKEDAHNHTSEDIMDDQDWKSINSDNDLHFMDNLYDQESTTNCYVSMSEVEGRRSNSSKGGFLSFFYRRKWSQK